MLTLIACDVDTDVFTSDKMQVTQVYLKVQRCARSVYKHSVAQGAV